MTKIATPSRLSSGAAVMTILLSHGVCAQTLPGEPAKTTQGNGAVTQISGFGNSVPLVDAVKLIAPSGWTAKITGPGTQNTPVSWTSSGTWQDTLRNIGARHDLSTTIDPDTRNITISPNGTSPVQTASAGTGSTPTSRANHHSSHAHHRARHATHYASREWHGGSRYDSPTIYNVPPYVAEGMMIPTHGTPLNAAVPNSSTRLAAGSLSSQYAQPPFGQTYVPDRPVLPSAPATLAYGTYPDNHTWTARSGETFDAIIRRWAAESGQGWQVYSDPAHQPLTIRANITITGTFTDAIRELTESYQGAVTPVVRASDSPVARVVSITDSDHASPSLQ